MELPIDFSVIAHPLGVFDWLLVFWVLVVSPVSFVYCVILKHPRSKPEGYIGRFRMPSGEEVHVARMPDRTLLVISEETAGVTPRSLGTVSGPELVKWEKLSTTPDGNNRVPRPN